MAISQINSVAHLCEDTSQQFDLLSILAAAGYTPTLPISITQMYVLNSAGVPDTTVPAGLFTKVDADTVKVDATVYPDRNFSFNTLTILLDAGPNQVLVNLQVIVDPVNDAPTAEDHTITLNSAAGYVIKESDFGFADPHDANPANQANPAGNNFASVVITGLPPSGTLLLNGTAVAFGAEISIAEIRAGHLVYQPNASYGGQTAFGFEVRDDGGTAGCGASDLSLIHHMVFNIPNAMLGDRVWFDSNANGVQDASEAGAAGLTVSLKGAGADGVFGTADDVVLKTTTTDASGKYLFDHLTAGQYQVQFTTAAGYTYTGKDLGGNDATDSDAGTTGLSQVVTLAANETNLTVDAGLTAICTSSLGDRVWYDTNANGVQDSTETGAAGLTVSLKTAGVDGVFGTADDVTLRTTTTSGTGNYLFSGLAAGQYQVQFTTAAGYTYTGKDLGGNDATDSDANITTGRSQVVALAAGETNLTVDAGLVRIDTNTASLGDRLWYDTNANGIQDAGEAGIAGVTVQLLQGGVVIGTTTTSSTGYYGFNGLAAGQYQVQFGGVANYVYTYANIGDEALDSDVDIYGRTEQIALAIGQVVTNVDAGMVFCDPYTSSLGDRVWYDTNANGVQDSTETGAAGLTVSLKTAGADGVFGTADDVTLRTTTTDASGKYLFNGLAAGQYQVQFATAAGYTFTGKDLGGNDATDSDANVTTGRSQVVTLGVGETNLTVDAGLAAVCTSSIGDRVWYDTNNNGVQDSTEAGAAGQTVLLRGAGADGVFGTADDVTLASTTTDANGKYLFSGLAAGQYQVKFITPTNYGFTGQDLGGNDATDSDANASTGLSQVVTLAANQSNLTVDAGLVCRTASIGDRVWVDSIANGVQDSGEVGMAGVFVSLKTAGADGVFGTADDVVQRTTTTDANGNYLFDHLAAGQYQVAFTGVTGYNFTAQDLGGNDATDSDVNTNGLSQVVTLVNGQANMTVDAGLLSNAMLGDRIWYDTNGNGIQDAGETGVAGVTVQLRAAGADGVLGTADDVYRNATTNATGNYVFGYLTPGTLYQVGVVTSTLPAGYQLTKQDAGTSDNADSDANVTTGWMQSVRLAAGEQNMSFDAGVVKCIPAACASIVGATTMYEGSYANYQVHLSQAVTADTQVWVSAIDGTAGRTANHAVSQTISAGGYCDGSSGTRYYNQYWDSTGTQLYTATGPSDQSWDYSLFDTNGNIVGSAGGFWATIKAGQTDSAYFKVEAYQESVFVDRNAFPNLAAGWWQEAAWENFTLNLSNSTNSNVTFCQPNTSVCIGDTSCYTVVSPIALDLDGNGIHSTALIDSKGKFDMGSGTPVNSGWLSSGDGFLAIDSNGNGKIDDITELFGGNKGDGFAKLASYDSNHDGFVNAKDADFAKLLVWQDLNGNHQTDAGELRSLAQAGIASLTVAFTDQSINQLGNVLGETSTATRADGSSMAMTDVYFNIAPQDAGTVAATAPQVSSQIAQLLDTGNHLLDQAFGSQVGAVKTIEPVTTHHAAMDGGETLRNLLTAWNAHGTHGAHAMQMAR